MWIKCSWTFLHWLGKNSTKISRFHRTLFNATKWIRQKSWQKNEVLKEPQWINHIKCDIDRLKANVKIFAIYLISRPSGFTAIEFVCKPTKYCSFHLPLWIAQNKSCKHRNNLLHEFCKNKWKKRSDRHMQAIQFVMRAHLSVHRKSAIYLATNYKNFYYLFLCVPLAFVILWIKCCTAQHIWCVH